MNTKPDKPKILAVDDRPENLRVYEEILRDLDIEMITAQSGQQALALALQYEFALVLLDVQMPEMDGIETAELLRGRKKSGDVPIIFVTAGEFNQSLRFQGYEMGAVDFLFKPFDPHVLISKVRVFAELDRKNRQLKLAKEAADAANRAKSAFLANMSHEIRTPLNAILGFTALLKESSVTHEDREKFHEIIDRSGSLLLTLIDDILDLSRVESGKMQIEKTHVVLSKVLDDVRAAFAEKAATKGVAFHIERQEPVPAAFLSDPTRLRQILLNLVGNAVKFTPPGGTITLTVSFEKQRRALKYVVADTGIGIDINQIEKIFDPFHQADCSLTRKFGGTGLGLALSRCLAEALGGELYLEHTVLGKGSRFALVMPVISVNLPVMEASATASQTAEPSSSLEGMRVLLAEDNRDTQLLVERVLSQRGAQLMIADNGQQALEMEQQNRFDVILMDMRMPLKDGFETTRELRSRGFSKPIIALTAHALQEERERSLDCGCNAFLTKPINQSELLATLAKIRPPLRPGRVRVDQNGVSFRPN
jgi:signal transduction histidine kinase/BarA-like signal transduction histidine kinase